MPRDAGPQGRFEPRRFQSGIGCATVRARLAHVALPPLDGLSYTKYAARRTWIPLARCAS